MSTQVFFFYKEMITQVWGFEGDLVGHEEAEREDMEQAAFHHQVAHVRHLVFHVLSEDPCVCVSLRVGVGI